MSIPVSIKSGKNETFLPSRYEIHQLQSKHIPWASAIVMHSNMFHSPVWPVLYPEEKTKRFLKGIAACDYLSRHQIDSGFSYGVFDTQYKYMRPESVQTEGGLYFDENDFEADSATLLQQMDFPLVSVALAYDGINPIDLQRLMPLVETLPAFATLYHALEILDKRDPASWKPTHPHEVLMRNATATRVDYEGNGLMKKLAQWLMREAAGHGFHAINIECAHNAVHHVWSNPPEPFKADVISSVDSDTYELEEEDGKKSFPLRPSKQVFTKVYVSLSNDEPRGIEIKDNPTSISPMVDAVG